MSLRGEGSLKRVIGVAPSDRRVAPRFDPSAPPAETAPEGDRAVIATFQSTVRGMRFASGAALTSGERLRCIRQPDNPADPDALGLYRHDGARAGYLSREVAARLASFIDAGRIVLEATVIDVVQAKRTRKVTIKVRVLRDCDSAADEIDDAIEAAVQAATESSHESASDRILCENLGVMVETVLQQSRPLMKPFELELCQRMGELPPRSKALLLRLYLRKGVWFRTNELDYFDAETTGQMCIQELTQTGFLLSSDDLSCRERMMVSIEMLSSGEIKEFLRQARQQGIRCCLTGNKQKLTSELHKVLTQNPKWTEVLQGVVGTCVTVSHAVKEVLKIVELLFFLDPSHDLSSFLLQELGIMRWPKYRQQFSRSVFADRRTLDDYLVALQQATALDLALRTNSVQEIEMRLAPAWQSLQNNHHKTAWTSGATTDTLPNDTWISGDPVPLFLARFSASWVYVTMATVGVSYLERCKRYRDCVEKLRSLLGGNACPARRGMWWNRLIVDLQHLKRPTEALETCTSALADSWVRHGDRIAIKRQILKLHKHLRRWKLPNWAPNLSKKPKQVTIQATPLNSDPGYKSQFVGKSGEPVSVEQVALEHFEEERNGSWQGIHTESSLWHTLSCPFPQSAMEWSALHLDVADVFRTPFQAAPLDFGTDAFFPARQDLVLQQLDLIEGGDFQSIFSRVWDGHYGEVCRGVNWDRYSVDRCREMMDCIGGSKLAAMCRLFAEDYKAVSGGLPDLFLWNIERCQCKLVEVKGPKDRLSDQQWAWIDVLTEHGFQVEVFKVLDTRCVK